MRLEPPDADVPARRPLEALNPVRLAASAGAAVMALTSVGDVLLLAVILGVAAADLLAGTAAVLAAVGVVGRWGTSSLAALAGGQAVVGPAGWTGSTRLAVSAWCAAGAN